MFFARISSKSPKVIITPAASKEDVIAKPILRSAFGRAGKHHLPPDKAPEERAMCTTAKMAAEKRVFNDASTVQNTGKVDARSDETNQVEQEISTPESGLAEDNMLAGVNGAETPLAKPALLSSRYASVLQRGWMHGKKRFAVVSQTCFK